MDPAPLTKLRTAASILSDGHFTIYRFTTNWRVQLGTPNANSYEDSRDIIGQAFEGKTLDEAVEKLLTANRSTNRRAA